MKILFSIIAIILTINGFAQTETFDIVTFSPPQSWKRDTQAGSVSFTASKGNAFCVAGLYKSRLINSVSEKEFLTEWNELVNIPFGISDKPLISHSMQNGWNVFSGSTNVTTKQSGTYTIKLVSYAADGKIISASINSNSALFNKEEEAFLSSIALIKTNGLSSVNIHGSQGEATALTISSVNKPITPEPGIAGVWVGFENGKYVFGVTSYDYVNNRNNYGSTYKATAQAIKWRVFWSDGKYYDGMPHDGLINFNRNDPKNDYAGSYSMDRNMVTAKMDHYSSANRLYVFYPPAKLKYLDKYEYVKCQPVDGLTLNGTYNSADPTSIAYYISLNKPNPTISFTTNGQFIDDNYIGEYANDPKLRPGSGKYEIKNFTIILNYDDGRVLQRSFTAFLNESPATSKIFYIGSRDMKLKP
ncbi:MAG: hypothetical protein WCR72_00090 [Bacteroidota bacterium]